MPVPPALAAHALRRGLRSVARPLLARPFTSAGGRRILVLYHPSRIAWSQVYPLIAHHRALAERHGVQLRLFPSTDPEHPLPHNLAEADGVLLQTWLTDGAAPLLRWAERIRALPRQPAYAYLDAFANADIRFARHLTDARIYLKKSALRDPSRHLGPHPGETEIQAYYGALYGLEVAEVDWHVPAGFPERLRIGPNFLTDPGFSRAFAAPRPPAGPRPIDLHARFADAGSEWYGAMRRHARRAAQESGAQTVPLTPDLPRKKFLAELRASKMVFSPFGYGEICWRDVEAIAAGAVLVKPDMRHLATRPDLYEDGVTYVACRWDFSDLANVVQGLLADPERRAALSQAAYARARAYLAGPMLDDLAPLFTEL
jgi:glycosyltransferase involved in cell wall biosynthesis